MRKLLTSMMIVFSLSVVALAQGEDAQAKAGQILKQARAALGDEAKLKSLQSLSASAISRRTVGETRMESEIEYEILLPDKFRRSENSQPFTTITVMEDDKSWTYRIPTNPASNEGQARGPVNTPDPQAQARRQTLQRAEFTRVLLGWLLITPSFEPVEYSYAGELREPDTTADLIDVKGKDGFKARLYLEQKTHRLMMLTYQGKPVSQIMRTLGRTGGPGNQRPPQDDKKLTPEEQAKRRQERQLETDKRRKEFLEALAKAPDVEFRWIFSEYKNVKGLSLPHHLIKSEAGRETEEWEISLFRINPKLPADRFEMKDKP